MYDAPGIGLAAIQIGIPKRIVVMDLSKDLMERIITDTKEIGQVEVRPKFEGRQMIMIIQPN
jgi:peptide deformylase